MVQNSRYTSLIAKERPPNPNKLSSFLQFLCFPLNPVIMLPHGENRFEISMFANFKEHYKIRVCTHLGKLSSN